MFDFLHGNPASSSQELKRCLRVIVEFSVIKGQNAQIAKCW